MSEISLVKFAEKMAGRKLTDSEKVMFTHAEECRKNGTRAFIITARYSGRRFAKEAIAKYNELFPIKEESE